MPRRSKLTNTQIMQMQTQTVKTVVETVDGVIETITEEAIWLAMMADLFLIGGELWETREDFLIAQRKAVIATLSVLAKENIVEGDFLFFEKGIPNPMAFVFGWLRPLVQSLDNKQEKRVQAGIDPRDGVRKATKGEGWEKAGLIDVNIYAPMPAFERFLLSLMIPGLFRLSIKTIAGKII